MWDAQTRENVKNNNNNAETSKELAGRVEAVLEDSKWREVTMDLLSYKHVVPTFLSAFAGSSRKISELQFEFLHEDRQRPWKARRSRHCEPGKSCQATPEQMSRAVPWRKKGRQEGGFSWNLKGGEECALEQ